ncbi:MAG: thermonuclease family protein, partial [Brevinematia bacterium]
PSTKIILYIPIHKPEDGFGRILAVVLRIKDRVVINELLLTTGNARTYYLKDAPLDVANFYLSLEKTSKKERKGIWKNFKE